MRSMLGWAVGLAVALFTACGTDTNGEGPPDAGGPDASSDDGPVAHDGGGTKPDGAGPADGGGTTDAPAGGDGGINPPPPPQDLAHYVDPLIGTGLALTTGGAIGGGQGGSVFPGADVPFGMVQFSPDTPNGQPSGYLYTDTTITSFSLTHFSGAGCPNGGDVQLLPVVSASQTSITYAKADEHAAAGYYSVKTADGVTSELTATPRAGVARFSFPASGGTLVVDASKNEVFNPVGSITISGKTLDGVTWSGKFCGSQNQTQLWFHAEFDQPFSATKASGGKVLLAFPGSAPVTMGVAISYVSAANAKLNYTTEVGASTFDQLHAAATAAWNAKLNAIQVTGGDDAEKTKLYTALYHALLHPNLFSDVNGEYVGFDKQTHTAPAGHAQYANYSGWDIYRTQVQLVSFLFPDIASDMLQSLVNDAQTCGYFVMWSQNNADDNVMAGDPGALIMANGYAFGARAFDQKTTLQILTHPPAQGATCSNPEVFTAGSPYVAQGYLTPNYYGGAASSTLELSNRDFAVAQLAKALGDDAHARLYLGRAGTWKYLYTPYQKSGGGAPGPMSLQARDANGKFVTPMMAPADENSTIEGSSEQYLWFVPFAIPDLVTLLGGPDAFTARLDTFLTKLNDGQSSAYLYMGNEPDFEIPWEYNWAGAPSHTQAAIRRIVETVFDTTPNTGLPGNDDLGATSSWLVWAMLGMYPEVPGVGGWTLAAPTFDGALLYASNGTTIQISASQQPGPYIQSATLNGAALKTPWIDLPAPNSKTAIAFALGPTASTWGTGADAPFNPYPSTAPDFPSAANNEGIFDETGTADTDLDGDGYALSKQALAAAGLTSGSPFTIDGLTFTWPQAGVDNVVPVGQTIRFASPITATKIGFLATSTNGPSTGSIVVTAAGGKQTAYPITVDDWAFGGVNPPPKPAAPNRVAASAKYRSAPPSATQPLAVYVFYVPVALGGPTSIESITLPSQLPGTGILHLFAFASQ